MNGDENDGQRRHGAPPWVAEDWIRGKTFLKVLSINFSFDLPAVEPLPDRGSDSR
jgi:hypothetical protein